MIRFLCLLFAIACITLPHAAKAQQWDPWTYGKPVVNPVPPERSNKTQRKIRDHEFGIRYWISSAENKFEASSPKESSLDYEVDESHSGESFFYLTSPTSRFLFKGVVGFGGSQSGELENDTFDTTNGQLIQQTTSNISDGGLFYAYADLGVKIPRLKTPSSTTSFLLGGGYFQDSMMSKGAVCTRVTASSPDCTTQGEILFGNTTKSIQNDARWIAMRVGLENFYNPHSQLAWHNEIILIPYAVYKNLDSHYLATENTPNFIDRGRSYGVQLESSLDYRITSRWSLNMGARYWRFWTPSTKTRIGNPASSEGKAYNWDYERVGLFLGTGYRF